MASLTQKSSLIVESVKNMPAMQETRVQLLGWEDPLEKEMSTHSSILAWRIPWTRGAWQATIHRIERVRHDLATNHHHHHRQLNGHEFEQTLGDSEGQGNLACCSPWVAKSQTQLSDSTKGKKYLGKNPKMYQTWSS